MSRILYKTLLIDSNSFSLHSWHQCCFCPWMDPRTRTERTLCFLQQPTEIYKFVYIVVNKKSPKKTFSTRNFIGRSQGGAYNILTLPRWILTMELTRKCLLQNRAMKLVKTETKLYKYLTRNTLPKTIGISLTCLNCTDLPLGLSLYSSSELFAESLICPEVHCLVQPEELNRVLRN